MRSQHQSQHSAHNEGQVPPRARVTCDLHLLWCIYSIAFTRGRLEAVGFSVLLLDARLKVDWLRPLRASGSNAEEKKCHLERT